MMSQTYGKTPEEIRSRTIAHHLVTAIEEIETFFGDPHSVLLDAELIAKGKRGNEILSVVQYLKSYFRKES